MITGVWVMGAVLTTAALQAPPPTSPEPPDPGVAVPVVPVPVPVPDEVIGPRPGAPTVGLPQAVALALEQNFAVLGSADAVASSRMRESASRSQFLPKLTPLYQRTSNDSRLGLEATQRLPWTGGQLSASAGFRSDTTEAALLPRTSDLRLQITQPLLRGFGPNATFFDLRNSRRSRESHERIFELSRQRLAVDVTRTFYDVIQQRQLLAVAKQSLKRSESLRLASEARLQVGLVSKLDVFRAELQASQAEDAMVRSEASLQSALERFRTLLGLSPTDEIEPEAMTLAEGVGEELEPLDVLVARALDRRLDLAEVRDQVEDSRRSASLARQNILPQLDLGVGLTQIGSGPGFGSALRAGDRRFNVFVITSYPLERSTEAVNRAVAELDVAARRRGLRQRELDVQAEVRAAVRELERIRKSIELQRKGVEVADQQRRLATLRYQRGLASNFDVVDAEGSLVLARSALVGLVAGYHVARMDLRRVTGDLDPDAEARR